MRRRLLCWLLGVPRLVDTSQPSLPLSSVPWLSLLRVLSLLSRLFYGHWWPHVRSLPLIIYAKTLSPHGDTFGGVQDQDLDISLGGGRHFLDHCGQGGAGLRPRHPYDHGHRG